MWQMRTTTDSGGCPSPPSAVTSYSPHQGWTSVEVWQRSWLPSTPSGSRPFSTATPNSSRRSASQRSLAGQQCLPVCHAYQGTLRHNADEGIWNQGSISVLKNRNRQGVCTVRWKSDTSLIGCATGLSVEDCLRIRQPAASTNRSRARLVAVT